MKLTRKEINEIERMLSYYSSLDLDVSGEGSHEKDFLSGLTKLYDLYRNSNSENLEGWKGEIHGDNSSEVDDDN